MSVAEAESVSESESVSDTESDSVCESVWVSVTVSVDVSHTADELVSLVLSVDAEEKSVSLSELVSVDILLSSVDTGSHVHIPSVPQLKFSGQSVSSSHCG